MHFATLDMNGRCVVAAVNAAGVGLGCEPPRFLKPGDVTKLIIGILSTLTNRVN